MGQAGNCIWTTGAEQQSQQPGRPSTAPSDNISPSVVTNTHFQVFKYFGKYLVSDEYLNTI